MIVFFLPSMKGGGAERVLITIILELHKNNPKDGYSILLNQKEGDFLVDIPPTIPVYSLETTRALNSVLPFIKFCKENTPKVVVSCLGASFTTSLARPFLSKDITIINRIGNTIGAEKKLYTNILRRFLFISANKVINKNSDHIIFQCQYMYKDYIKETGIHPKQFDVIYNPVDLVKIQQKSEENIDRTFDFIAVGRLMEQKDYLTMIRGFSELLKAEPKLTLAILGKGKLEKQLSEEITKLGVESNIYLLGFVPNPYPYMKHARFLVSSSLFEGFSNVIIESLCLGTPVIASDCPGGNKETITPNKNGLFFNVNDPKSLAETLHQSLKLTALKSTNIAHEASIKYNKKHIVNQYYQLIQKYIN